MTVAPITTEVLTRSIIVYDLEWYPKKLDVRLVGVFDGERYYDYPQGGFASVRAFLAEWLIAEHSGKWFYGHYGGMADIQFILHEIQKDPRYEVEASFSGSSAIIVNIRLIGTRLSWTFIDSFWLLKDKLENIGKAIGLLKTTHSYQCSDYPDCGHRDAIRRTSLCMFYAPLPVLRDYNEQDCRILWTAITRFEAELQALGGQLQMTIASCAMHLFRRKYLKQEIRTLAYVNESARKAYTSSRVEVFQDRCVADGFNPETVFRDLYGDDESAFDGNAARQLRPEDPDDPYTWQRKVANGNRGPVPHYYDINSSFPYAMTKPCPGEMRTIDQHLPPGEDTLYLADAEIEVPPMYLPPLPYRHKGRIFFPTGRWRSWFSGEDLQLLEENGGTIHKVFEVVTFHPMEDLRDYALDLYELRKNEKEEFRRIVLKYLLNSLYGKWAEQSEKTALWLNPQFTTCQHKPKHRCDLWPRCVHGRAKMECNGCIEVLWPGALLVTQSVVLQHEHVPIAVDITARARRNLYNFLKAAQADVYYCDTDSLVTTRQMPTSKELGGLKHEYDLVGGVFVAPKVYATLEHVVREPHDDAKPPDPFELEEGLICTFKRHVKAKGFSHMTYERFLQVQAGEEVAVERMTRVRELFRKGNSAPVERVYLKRFQNAVMAKRCLDPSGQSRAWSLAEIHGNFMRIDLASPPTLDDDERVA